MIFTVLVISIILPNLRLISSAAINEVSRFDEGGRNPMHYAFWRGDYEKVKTLISEHIEWLQEKDELGLQPFYYLFNSHNQRNDNGETDKERQRILGLLAGMSTSKDMFLSANPFNQKTPLMIIAERGKTNLLKDILSIIPIGLRSVDEDGNTALMLAVSGDYVDCVAILYHQDPSYMVTNRIGWTAFHIAAHYGSTKSLAYLLRFTDWDPNVKDKSGLTPIQIAINRKEYEVAKMILEATQIPL